MTTDFQNATDHTSFMGHLPGNSLQQVYHTRREYTTTGHQSCGQHSSPHETARNSISQHQQGTARNPYTTSESEQAKRVLEQGRSIADRLTYFADLTRERIIQDRLQDINMVTGEVTSLVDNGEADDALKDNDAWQESSVSDYRREVSYTDSNSRKRADMKAVDQAVRKNDDLAEQLRFAMDCQDEAVDGGLSARKMRKIVDAQAKHRREDLNRLMLTFATKWGEAGNDAQQAEWKAKMDLVAAADPTMELEPQLGFDADDY